MNEHRTPSPSNPRYVSNTISLGVFSIFSMFLGLAGTILITHHFSTEDFGVYTLVLVLVSFLSQISTFGLDMAVSRFIAGAKDEESKERFLSTSVVIRIGAILLASLFMWFGEPLLRMLFGQSLQPGVILYVPLLFAVESFRTLLKSILQGVLRFTQIGISDLFTSSTNFFLVLVVVFGINGNINDLILSKVFSTFLGAGVALVSIPIKKRISFNADIFRELMKFGFPLQINDFLSFIFLRIDTIVIAAFLGPTEIALYEVARKIPDYLRNLYEPFRLVYYPNVAKGYLQEGRVQSSSILNAAVRFVAFVTLFGTAFAILFGHEIIQFLFSDKYTSSAPILALLMFNLSIALTSNVMGTTLVAVGDTQKPMIINIFNALASWLGSISLVPVYALLGAAIANTLGTIVAYPLNIYFLRKKMDLGNISYLKPLGLFCIWYLLVFLLNPTSFVMKVVLLIIFLLGGFSLSIITKDDLIHLIEESGITFFGPLKKLKMYFTKQ